jgi:hypothetical protein
MTTHGCGGQLFRATVSVSVPSGPLELLYVVDGFTCDRCGDHVIAPETMRQLEGTVVGERFGAPIFTYGPSPAILYRPGTSVRSTFAAAIRPETISTRRSAFAFAVTGQL